MKMNLILCGVGGQGNLLASVAIANYAMKEGLKVIGTETIGAAQRGGSVVSHLRFSDEELFSPIVPSGSADVLLGFEPMESLRHISKIAKDGIYIINVETVPTVLCNMGLDSYPSVEGILAELDKASARGYSVNATEKARELGGVIMTNVVLLGVLVKVVDFFKKDVFLEVLQEIIPEKALDINLEAFEAGYNMMP